MRLSFGGLEFEAGDVLQVEDSSGEEAFYAAAGHDCGRCEFRGICDGRNAENKFARFCRTTHFESKSDGRREDG